MPFARNILCISPLFVLVSCSVSDPASSNSKTQSTQDMLSSQKRTDGRFDVVCKDGTHEIVTAKQITDNAVCPSTPTPPPVTTTSVVTVDNQQVGNLIIGQTWNGKATFVAKNSCVNYKSEIKDSSGKKWVLEPGQQSYFNEISLPVSFAVPQGAPRCTQITATAYILQGYNDVPSQVSELMSQTTGSETFVSVIGNNLVGGTIELDINAIKYANYATGKTNMRLYLRDKNGKQVDIVDVSSRIKLVAPINLYSQWKGNNENRLTTGMENPDKDYDVFIENVQVGSRIN